MAQDKLGTKRSCPFCEAKFFDLNKNPMVCPICKAEIKLEDILKKRGDAKTSKKVEKDILLDDSMIDGDFAVKDVLEDVSDLGDDESDMSDVIDNLEQEEREDI